MKRVDKKWIKEYFEDNYLDGDKVTDCGGAKFDAEYVLEVLIDVINEFTRPPSTSMIICKICNPNLKGNGYCAQHSTGGSSYLVSTPPKENLDKDELADLLAEYYKHPNCKSHFKIENFICQEIQTAKKEAKKELVEKIEKIIEKEAGFYYRDASCGNSSEVTAIELAALRKGLKNL